MSSQVEEIKGIELPSCFQSGACACKSTGECKREGVDLVACECCGKEITMHDGGCCKLAASDGEICSVKGCPAYVRVKKTVKNLPALENNDKESKIVEVESLPLIEINLPQPALPEEVMSADFIKSAISGSVDKTEISEILKTVNEINLQNMNLRNITQLQHAIACVRASMPYLPRDITVQDSRGNRRFSYTSLAMIEQNLQQATDKYGVSYHFTEDDDIKSVDVTWQVKDKGTGKFTELSAKLAYVRTFLVIQGFGVEVRASRQNPIDFSATGMSVLQATHTATSYNKRILLSQVFCKATATNDKDFKSSLEGQVLGINRRISERMNKIGITNKGE